MGLINGKRCKNIRERHAPVNIVKKNNAVFTDGKNNSIEITNTERVGMLCMASIAISMEVQQHEKCKWY